MQTVGLGTFVTYNPTVVEQDTLLEDVLRLMEENTIRHLPVVDDERRVVGIVSDRDVARAVLESRAGDERTARRVATIMVHNPLTIQQDDPPKAALTMILANRFHSLPVVDGERLVGMVTSSDFLRELTYGELASYREPVDRYMSDDIAIAVDATATLAEVQRVMRNSGNEYLAVTRGECPVGIVSLRDVRRAHERVAADVNPQNLSVLKLLGDSAATISPHTRLGEAASLMLDERMQALSVVDRSNRLVGLLTEDDVLQAMEKDLG